MQSLHDLMVDYKQAMLSGEIKAAYQGLLGFMQRFRLQMKNSYPDYNVAANIYAGSMDISFFSFSPEPLQRQQLKVLVVFEHKTCGFQVWLAGRNKGVQHEFLGLIERSSWRKYQMPGTTKGVDYILKGTLTDKPNFRDLDKLSATLDAGIQQFVTDVEKFLSKHAI